jgi:hypothetical protein
MIGTSVVAQSAIRAISVVLLAVCTASGSLLAAQEMPLEAGARVRVKAPPSHPNWENGTLSGWTDESLVLAPEDARIDSPLRLARDQIAELEVYRGRKSAAGKGALYGLLGGAVAGLGFALISCEGWTESCVDDGYGTGDVAVFTTLLGAAGGAAIGALIGLAAKTNDWEPVPMEGLRISIGPHPGGRWEFALSATF